MTTAISPVLLRERRGPDATLPPDEYYEERIQSYRDAWEAVGTKILTGMTEALGLSFYLPVIDATFAPMIPAFSTPLTLNYRPEPDELIEMLAHELIHILLSDNRENVSFRGFLQSRWPDENLLTRNHIAVHAVLRYIYLEILRQPHRLERDIEKNRSNPPYARAWGIVMQSPDNSIVSELRAIAQ